MSKLTRHFVTVKDSGQVHYWRGGSGPAVCLMHASPQSARMILPFAEMVAEHFTVLALDFRGYGMSDPLPGDPDGPYENLDAYIEPYKDMLDALGIEKAVLWGMATGALMAQEFSARHPDRVAMCMQDTGGHKDPVELVDVLDGYFPDCSPRRDGGHLLTWWDQVRSLNIFMPWQWTNPLARLDRDLPDADYLQDKMIDYMRAGAKYHLAYRGAFMVGTHKNTIAVDKVPATLMRWEGKPSNANVDTVIEMGLPDNWTVLHAGPTMEDRLQSNLDHMIATIPTLGMADAPPPPAIAAEGTAILNDFITLPDGQMRIRKNTAGGGRPVIVLHGPGGSADLMDDVTAHLAGVTPVYALDLPNHGETEIRLKPEDLSVANYAQTVLQAMDVLDLEEADVIGRNLGGVIGLEAALQAPDRIKHTVLMGPLVLSEGQRTNLLENGIPDLSAKDDGSHLVTAWNFIRDRALWWPWFERTAQARIDLPQGLDATRVDAEVFQVLKAGSETVSADYAMTFSAPVADMLQASKVPGLIIVPDWLPLKDATTDAASGGMSVVESPPEMLTERLTTFFES